MAVIKALFKPSVWRILGLFYENKNKPIHLREIARRAGINESTASGHLNGLVKAGVLGVETEANLKKFFVSDASEIFPAFDSEKLNSLSSKNKIKNYIREISEKPEIVLINDSDKKIGLIFVYDSGNRKLTGNDQNGVKRSKQAREKVGEAKFNITKINKKELKKEVNLRKDVFPVYNAKYFYEVINE